MTKSADLQDLIVLTAKTSGRGNGKMTKEEQQFNQWFDEYADGVKVFEEADMKQAYLQGRAELEKENKVLAQNLEDTEIINKALEKENAELKHTIAILRQEKDNASMHAKAMEVVAKTRSDQLTNAKELLKQWLSLCGFKVEKLSKDTKQFLNSEVEK